MGRVLLLIPTTLLLLGAEACHGDEGPASAGQTRDPAVQLAGAVVPVSDRAVLHAGSEGAGAEPEELVGGHAAPQTSAASEPDDAHGDLTCATCHRGRTADTGEAAVPGTSCAASGCHTDGGPARLILSTVEFQHRAHGGDTATVAMSCSGCHSHTSGDEPITAGTDACTLCHSERLRGVESGDCRFCHVRPTFERPTSQGVPIPHDELPWIQGECVRCHFDVAEPPTRVSAARCTACHSDRARVTAAGIGEDLHPTHTGVGCTSCHAAGDHHIVAMSSAVDLQCSHCHVRAHGVAATETFPGTATCNDCHRPVHQDQQRLVLGVVSGLAANPSEKFLDGLTCRSCHLPSPSAAPGPTVGGSGASCTGCHRPEYATVLGWWNQGAAQRSSLAEAYVSRAEGALAGTGSDDTAALLAEARELLGVVQRGHGAHNLPLGHRLLGESVQRAQAAYQAEGRAAPPVPDLGGRPRMGTCSYCHFRLDQRQLRALTSPEERFHREVLGVRETGAAGG